MNVDFLIVSDFAEIANGKLYLQGGGWDQLIAAQPFPFARAVGLAVGFDVPWNETNQRFNVHVEIIHDDSQRALASVDGTIEVGRPAGLLPGQPQLFMMAVNAILTLEAPGEYVVIISVEGEERKRRAFRVHASPTGRPTG